MIISDDQQQICQIIQSGGVVAYPTEAVFGLGCDPQNPQAIQKILDLKSRFADKGLILLGSSYEQFTAYIEPLTPQQQDLISTHQVHPTTWVVPSKLGTDTLIRGQFNTLAIRISQHLDSRKLCETVGFPLISTSANPQGEEPAISVEQVVNYFSDQVDAVFDGELGGYSKPSRLVDISSKTLLRT